MGYYASIYVIKKTRSKQLALAFIDHFIPNRIESAECYEIPRLGDKIEITFHHAEELMEYAEKKPTVDHCVYWRNTDKKELNRFGMIFYTSDSYMIFGISRDILSDFRNTKNAYNGLTELKRYFDTDDGYIVYESPPEYTYSDFKIAVDAFNKR